MYAWTDLKTDKGFIKQGAEVTAADVGGKEALAELQAAGSVRKDKYPVPDGVVDSPYNFLIRQKNEEIEKLQAGLNTDLAELASLSSNPDAA